MLNAVEKISFQAIELPLINAIEVFIILSAGDEMLFKKIIVFNQNLISGQNSSVSPTRAALGRPASIIILLRAWTTLLRPGTSGLWSWTILARTIGVSIPVTVLILSLRSVASVMTSPAIISAASATARVTTLRVIVIL